ncbi:MAG TPA: hypothetical protein DHV17_10710 [Chitinophagaceae bacterium]|nr:hypothetical protein [Chitinophagaceae bacterium]
MQRIPRLSCWISPLSAISQSFFGMLLVMLLAQSCKTTKPTTVFEQLPRDTSLMAFIPPAVDMKIKANDLLSIQVSSLNRELDEKFNSAAHPVQGYGNAPLVGFPVDADGQVQLHYLGKTKAGGLTLKEFAIQIEKGLEPYMKEPIVRVQYLSHKITVMGEVNRPQVVYMPVGQMTLFDALAAGGDLKEKGNWKDVMVIRDSSQVRLVKHINLESPDVFQSPWLYMQPNDIVYVKNRSDKLEKDERRRTLQTTLSLIATGVSLITILLTRVIN